MRLLLTAELDNIRCDALLPVEEKVRLGISDEVCFL
jgi:hypothetical protein